MGLKSLIALCRDLGADPLLVQARGGNVSVKTSEGMLIKASGARLADVGRRRGWALTDDDFLRSNMESVAMRHSFSARDRAYAALLSRAGRTPGWRVSMEAGFHAMLPDRCVAHLHSVAGIIAGMLPEKTARRKMRRILGRGVDIYFVPVCVPGADLTLKMRGRKSARRPCLWILKNHGIVWGAPTAAGVMRLSARFERELRREYALTRFKPPRPRRLGRGWYALNFDRWPSCSFDLRPMFPDFVVYFDLWGRRKHDLLKVAPREAHVFARNADSLRTKSETLFAHALISTAGRRIRRLPRDIVRAIDRLETERLRLRQAVCKG